MLTAALQLFVEKTADEVVVKSGDSEALRYSVGAWDGILSKELLNSLSQK